MGHKQQNSPLGFESMEFEMNWTQDKITSTCIMKTMKLGIASTIQQGKTDAGIDSIRLLTSQNSIQKFLATKFRTNHILTCARACSGAMTYEYLIWISGKSPVRYCRYIVTWFSLLLRCSSRTCCKRKDQLTKTWFFSLYNSYCNNLKGIMPTCQSGGTFVASNSIIITPPTSKLYHWSFIRMQYIWYPDVTGKNVCCT